MNSEEEVIKKQTGAMKLNQLQDFLLIDKQTPIIYKLLTDSLAKAQITIDQKKPTTFNKLYFNAMVSHWKPGLKIGANLMGFSGSLPSTGATMGYEIGIFLDRSFKNKDEQIGFWHSSRYIFQPGLTLTSKAGHFTTNNTRKSINIHYLALDLLNSYQFKGLRYYRIFASPYVATGLWATQKQVEERQPLTFGDDFSRLDYGLRFGMSRNMGSFEPFIGYNFGLKDVKTGADVIHHRGFYASFAIIIGK